MNIVSENLLRDMLAAQPGTHILIEVPAFMASDPANVDSLCALQANGSTLLLKGRPLQELPAKYCPASSTPSSTSMTTAASTKMASSPPPHPVA